MRRGAGTLALIAFGTIAALAVTSSGLAQQTGTRQAVDRGFPGKPVRIIVGNSPGGANDIMGRLIAQRLHEAWGQPVIVENRAGGSGVIAMEIVAGAVPDGYTLLLSNIQMPTNMLLKKVAFDVRKAYTPVAELAVQPYVVTVHPALPVGSVKELIAYGLLAPAGTPRDTVAAINRQVNDIVSSKEFRTRLATDGVEAASPSSPADYQAALGRDIARLERFFKTPGVSIDMFR